MNASQIRNPKFFVSVILWIGLLVFLQSPAAAQISQRDTTAVRAPDLGLGAEVFGGLEATRSESGTTLAPESEGDADLGEQAIMGAVSEYDPFTVSLLAQGIFTSNAALTEENEIEDFYSYSEVALRYNPRITDKLFGDLSVDYGIYRYADTSSLDFDSLEGSAGLIRLFPELDNLVAWGNYNFTRLSDGHDGHDELLTDHSIEVGLYLPVPIAQKHLAFGSCLAEFSLGGEPEFTRRNEYGLTLGYAYLPTERLQLSAYYQFFVYDYLERGRLDLFQSVGLGAKWELSENLDIRLLTSYSDNDSNIREGHYVVGEAGTSLSLAFQF